MFPLVRSSISRSLSTSTRHVSYLVSPAEASKISNAAFLDASWFMPNSPRQPRTEFAAKHIPGAQFLDLDEVASKHELGLKHMMPSGEVFAAACESFGIEPSSHVVIYDSQGVFSSPRALFMFRSFNHQNSSVLDGGLPRWLAEGYPVETTNSSSPTKTRYEPPSLNQNAIKSYEQMVANSEATQDAAIALDARSRGRFTGADPEPRPGLSSGHIPNSFSLPFNMFLKTNKAGDGSEYTTFKSRDELQQTLVDSIGHERATAIIKGELPAITTCGSGMTAGVLWLGLRILGAPHLSLYDESWTGYASRPASKIVKSS